MSDTEALIYQMVAFLHGAGVDLFNETACMQALVRARFRCADISVHLDDVMARARDDVVSFQMVMHD